MKVLHIDSSVQGSASATRELTHEIVARLKAARPDAQLTYRDLAAQELPHFSQAALTRSDELEAARNTAVLEEFLAADVLVIGAPLYNFTIPSQLKAWVDRIAVAGRTFRYTERGPEGLAGGKQVIVAVARGGVYEAGSPAEFGESYLKFVFGFLGIRDVSFVRAEGLAFSPQHRESALSAARVAIPVPAALAA
ncbi:MAG TPA: NAD(P)H-dependent oxidoreductase [Steroidobacteraceae bacterium]|jgi:FMN-dependent NADH-azoreductase|nr:NAD(P)H-dependent oxidoreductase [Steroidobacteraceae bacterium]